LLFLGLEFLELVGDDEPGCFGLLVEPFEVEYDFGDVAFEFFAHFLLLLVVVHALVELYFEFLFLLAGQVVHVVLDGLDPPVYLDLEVHILLLQGYDRVLQDHDLVAQVYLLVVELLDGRGPVD
jgi:hypothetical protein